MKIKVTVLVSLSAMFVGLIATAGAAVGEAPGPKCSADEPAKKITVGIVQMIGCFTESTEKGEKIYEANPEIQPTYGTGEKAIRAIDMNGFLIDGTNPTENRSKDGMIVINQTTGAIRMVGPRDEITLQVKLYAIGVKSKTEPDPMGGPFDLSFTAPKTGSMLLEDFRFGTNNMWANALAGFSPAPDVETPVRLTEDGKGSMDMTLRLAGIFALKGKPQSATIMVPTKVGEGAHVDGFELHLQEIDGIKLIKINDLEAKYSAEEKLLGGGADFSLPFMSGKGVSFAFEIQDTVLTKASVGASGLEVPIGAPPAGVISALSGGFGFKKTNDEFVLNLNAAATAEFGPKIPTPWGKVVPFEVNSALKIGKERDDFYFLFDGGIKIFRLPTGNVFLRIHTNSGVEFGFDLGVGFPSYSNNREDPFYIGASVKGWIAKKRFQFEGSGRVRLIGVDIFDGRILINDKAAGACWKVTWFDGGAVYEYGAKEVKTFGIGCGLDHYKENYPSATRQGVAAVSAERPRKLTTGKREVVLSARGQDGAPRFRLTSPDGRSFEVPRGKDAVRTSKYMIVVDRRNKVTHVAAGGLANGNWTLTPYEGSAAIMGVKTGKALPPERVQARIVGKGLKRTLVWNSKGNPHTRLAFSEKMIGGYEQPILITDKVKGRYTFKATKGSHYGKRRLRAVVLHGGTPREATIEDRFRVRRPAKLRAPRGLRASRNDYTAKAAWRAVPGASGYIAEIAMKVKGKTISSYRRAVGPKKRSITIPFHPGGTWAIASVQALNADGVPGRIGVRHFRLAPPKSLDLKQANRRSTRSAKLAGGGFSVRTICPLNGHCQTALLIKLGNRTIGHTRYQQTPGTYRMARVVPKAPKLYRRLARGDMPRAHVVIRQHRNAG